ncbi:MAG: hypothetical protein IT381_21085 [Deltaproteobacteria bacterium]|nr:hypothetical protein [Deltaproteobacteria bacterium]
MLGRVSLWVRAGAALLALASCRKPATQLACTVAQAKALARGDGEPRGMLFHCDCECADAAQTFLARMYACGPTDLAADRSEDEAPICELVCGGTPCASGAPCAGTTCQAALPLRAGDSIIGSCAMPSPSERVTTRAAYTVTLDDQSSFIEIGEVDGSGGFYPVARGAVRGQIFANASGETLELTAVFLSVDATAIASGKLRFPSLLASTRIAGSLVDGRVVFNPGAIRLYASALYEAKDTSERPGLRADDVVNAAEASGVFDADAATFSLTTNGCSPWGGARIELHGSVAKSSP